MAELISLNQMIASLEYGTKLHLSVWFFVPVENGLLSPDPSHMMHTTPFCDGAKARPGGYARCTRCKKWANEKARRTRLPFAGYCIYGIYEACVPVEYDGRVIAVVYCGNAVPDPDVFRQKNAPYSVEEYLDTMDLEATPDRCQQTARALAAYLRLLLSTFPPEEVDRSGYIVRSLKQYAESNYLYQLRLSDVAEIFHYNEKYIGRVFKRETGYSFSQYVNALRLNRAKNLLRTTVSDIIEVALSSGFDNVSYFNRLFKVQFGVTPSEYRKTLL